MSFRKERKYKLTIYEFNILKDLLTKKGMQIWFQLWGYHPNREHNLQRAIISAICNKGPQVPSKTPKMTAIAGLVA